MQVHFGYPRFTADTQGFPEVLTNPIYVTLSRRAGIPMGSSSMKSCLFANHHHGLRKHVQLHDDRLPSREPCHAHAAEFLAFPDSHKIIYLELHAGIFWGIHRAGCTPHAWFLIEALRLSSLFSTPCAQSAVMRFSF